MGVCISSRILKKTHYLNKNASKLPSPRLSNLALLKKTNKPKLIILKKILSPMECQHIIEHVRSKNLFKKPFCLPDIIKTINKKLQDKLEEKLFIKDEIRVHYYDKYHSNNKSGRTLEVLLPGISYFINIYLSDTNISDNNDFEKDLYMNLNKDMPENILISPEIGMAIIYNGGFRYYPKIEKNIYLLKGSLVHRKLI